MDLAKSVSFKSYVIKLFFCCAGTVGRTTTEGPVWPAGWDSLRSVATGSLY